MLCCVVSIHDRIRACRDGVCLHYISRPALLCSALLYTRAPTHSEPGYICVALMDGEVVICAGDGGWCEVLRVDWDWRVSGSAVAGMWGVSGKRCLGCVSAVLCYPMYAMYAMSAIRTPMHLTPVYKRQSTDA